MSELTASQFVGNVRRNQTELTADKSLDYIFDTIDDSLLFHNFDFVDTVLATIPVSVISTDSLVGILTITAPWRTRLQQRENFYHRVQDQLSAHYPPSRAERILDGFH